MVFLRKLFAKRPFNTQKVDSAILTDREKLEQKTVEGAKKALKEYRRVFERLAEYDRA